MSENTNNNEEMQRLMQQGLQVRGEGFELNQMQFLSVTRTEDGVLCVLLAANQLGPQTQEAPSLKVAYLTTRIYKSPEGVQYINPSLEEIENLNLELQYLLDNEA